jgi:hypothetical protein
MKGNCFELILRRAIWGMAACLCLAFGLVTSAAAAPVTYTGFTITDGKLGNWQFHNARVVLRFDGDTNDVQLVQFPDPLDPTATAQVAIISKGTASITVSTLRRSVRATFAPNQIFVSLDQGTPQNGPIVGGRGVGFGAFFPSSPGGIEPSYPLGVEDGTIDWGDASTPSIGLQVLPIDLTESVGYSGRAFVCIGFPDKTCPAPTSAQALHTDKGDLFLYQPYMDTFDGDTIEAGFFLADVNPSRHSGGSTFLSPSSSGWGSKPITYNGYLITDVSLGGQLYAGAQVYISVASDASRAVPYTDSTSKGFINPVGVGQVQIRSGGRTVSAWLAPNQLYVYYDVTHASIGFGSYAGGRGYPLSLTSNQDVSGLVENSALWALSDIAANNDAANYTAGVPGLATDLTNATVLSAGASSCASGFDPVTTICSNLTPVPLYTSRGKLLLFEPYTDDETTLDGSSPYSVNWGIFWSELGSARD